MNNIAKKIKNLGKLPDSEMRLSDLFLSLSRALDMGEAEIYDHSRQVAYISLELAEELNLDKEERNLVVLTALIHDIGIISNFNKTLTQNSFELDQELVKEHCRFGSELTKKISFSSQISEIIYYHHHNWNGQNFDQVKEEDIPLASRIIYLADRIEALIEKDKFILNQIESIRTEIKKRSGSWFDPELVDVFFRSSEKECFWLNLESGGYKEILKSWGKSTTTSISLSNLESLASLMAHLIDKISPFTSRHSSGVATIAAMITGELNYSQKEQRSIRIAGLFHDLGKLIIPPSIIEKKDTLTDEEYKIVKQHTYYSYQLLAKIKGLGSIPEWAAFHHERLDGSGYPFRLPGSELNQGSRIMAVSDVFQALTEDRPYRSAFSISKALKIMDEMQQNGKLDSKIIRVLKNAI